eukprot:jgi/Mesvir1/23637/Mv18312-RA.3
MRVQGAYYYYVHEPGLPDMQATLLEVHRYATREKIPYRNALIDSYFYPHGLMNGVKNWTVRADVFPNGLAALASATSWFLQAHNRYWSPDTDYAAPMAGASHGGEGPTSHFLLPSGEHSGFPSRDGYKHDHQGAAAGGSGDGVKLGDAGAAGVGGNGALGRGEVSDAAGVGMGNKGWQLNKVRDGASAEQQHGGVRHGPTRPAGHEGDEGHEGEGDGLSTGHGDRHRNPGHDNHEAQSHKEPKDYKVEHLLYDGERSLYKFVMDEQDPPRTALPLERRFWDDLFLGSARPWGVVVYEQDWLNVQFLNLTAASRQPGLMRTWMLQMGDAATAAGLTIQYCMPLARHVLGTLEVPAVTQARASVDYPDSDDQWQVAPAALLLWALGMAPSKDTAWSSSVQPGNRYNRTEPYPDLQTAVLALSGGPVAYSDRIGYSTRWRILRTCREDGALLQPWRPLMPIYPWFLRQGGFVEGAVQGEVYEAIMRPLTEVLIRDEQGRLQEQQQQQARGPAWHSILAVDVKEPFNLLPAHLTDLPMIGGYKPTKLSSPSAASSSTSPRKMGSNHPSTGTASSQLIPPPPSSVTHVAYTYRVSDADGSISGLVVRPFSSQQPIQLAPCGRADFALWHVAPVLRYGWFVLGELAKVVPVAARRLVGVSVLEGGSGSTTGARHVEWVKHQRGEEGERIGGIEEQHKAGVPEGMPSSRVSRVGVTEISKGKVSSVFGLRIAPDGQWGENDMAAPPMLMLTLQGAPGETTDMYVGHIRAGPMLEAAPGEEDWFHVQSIVVNFPDDGRLILCVERRCDQEGMCTLKSIDCSVKEMVATE